jgi:hypothetical protein
MADGGKDVWVMGPLFEPSRLVAVLGDARSPILLTGDLATVKSSSVCSSMADCAESTT